jgi:hypothetical protein
MGKPGFTVANMLGGVYNGVLASTNGSTVWTAEQQREYIRSCYAGLPAKSLVSIMFGTNEQSKQLETAGLDCGVTPALFEQALQTIVTQIAADGLCVLLVSPCPSGSENVAAGAAPLTTYSAAMRAVAEASEHCAFFDIAEMWGTGAAAVEAAYNAGMRDKTSSHPMRRGYGDIARMFVSALINRYIALGN